MNANTKISAYCLAHVSDDELHVSARRLVGRSNELLAGLLAHLAEVESRGIHRERACASLYTYCIYELRMSEDAAFRRARAAAIARRFPVLFDRIAAGEIHLSGVLMLGPHLTEENHLAVLARAKHRTKREIAGLVRRLNPLPAVPALVEPLGPAPLAFVPGGATWSQLVTALNPVRELEPGDRPVDWVEGGARDAAGKLVSVEAARDLPGKLVSTEPAAHDSADCAAAGTHVGDGVVGSGAAGVQGEGERLLEPQRYKVQFTATQEYVDLLEEARDLLAHAVPRRSLEEVHLRAMRALVTELKKRKVGSTRRPSGKAPLDGSGKAERSAPATPRQRGESVPRERGESMPRRRGESVPRQRGRYVRRAMRRAVWDRDGGRCTYVDATGQRCRETGSLELHHIVPHARGGLPTESNLRLRCSAHNALAAETAFGREFMAHKLGPALLEARPP